MLLLPPCHKFTPQGVNTSSLALRMTGITIESWLQNVSAHSFIQKCTQPMRRDPSRWIGVTNQPRDLFDDDWIALPTVTPHSYWIKMCFYSYPCKREVWAPIHSRTEWFIETIEHLFVWLFLKFCFNILIMGMVKVATWFISEDIYWGFFSFSDDKCNRRRGVKW